MVKLIKPMFVNIWSMQWALTGTPQNRLKMIHGRVHGAQNVMKLFQLKVNGTIILKKRPI